MTTLSIKSRHAGAHGVPLESELGERVAELSGSINLAISAAEGLASHGVVESVGYDRLMDLLQEAIGVIAAIQAKYNPLPTAVFPQRALADAYIEKYPLDDDYRYIIRQDGHGRCTIAIYRLCAFV